MAWRREVESLEAHHPALALHTKSLAANLEFADWIRAHRFLQPVPVEYRESGMALLILWEVDHGCSFPSMAGEGPSSLLAGFNRRFKDRVRRDPTLSEWLSSRYLQFPLAPGCHLLIM